MSDALFILLVEKDAAFMRLAEDRFYNTYPCIIITAKGQPDVASRWAHLWSRFKVSAGAAVGVYAFARVAFMAGLGDNGGSPVVSPPVPFLFALLQHGSIAARPHVCVPMRWHGRSRRPRLCPRQAWQSW